MPSQQNSRHAQRALEGVFEIVIAGVNGLIPGTPALEGICRPLKNPGNEIFVPLREHPQIRRLQFLGDSGGVLCRNYLMH